MNRRTKSFRRRRCRARSYPLSGCDRDDRGDTTLSGVGANPRRMDGLVFCKRRVSARAVPSERHGHRGVGCRLGLPSWCTAWLGRREGLTIGHARTALHQTPIVYALPAPPANLTPADHSPACSMGRRPPMPTREPIHRPGSGSNIGLAGRLGLPYWCSNGIPFPTTSSPSRTRREGSQNRYSRTFRQY
jgi:hypothetical protein